MTRADMDATLTQVLVEQTGMSENEIKNYITAMSDEEMNEIFRQMIAEQVKAQYAEQVEKQLRTMSVEQLSGALAMALPSYTTEQCAGYYDEVLVFSSSSYDGNLRELGYVNLDNPASINL